MANAFIHIELNTDDPGKAHKFYKAVFPSWKFTVMPKMGYTMVDTGAKGGAGGGLTKKPMPQAPTQWLTYVAVDDVKKTLDKARKAGAQIVQDYMTIGEMGAIGIFVESHGRDLWCVGDGQEGAEEGRQEGCAEEGCEEGCPQEGRQEGRAQEALSLGVPWHGPCSRAGMVHSIDTERLLDRVVELIGGTNDDVALRAVVATLKAVGEALLPNEARALARVLPTPLSRALEAPPHRGRLSVEEFEARVALHECVGRGFAREHGQSVLRALGELLPPNPCCTSSAPSRRRLRGSSCAPRRRREALRRIHVAPPGVRSPTESPRARTRSPAPPS